MRLLLIEDNPKMLSAVQKGLKEYGFTLDVTRSGAEGEQLAATTPYDAVILDLMLSDHDGVQLCRNLRRREVATPILMLTALSSTDDKVAGLEAGADDYLVKPFDFEELVARLRALLRRGTATEANTLSHADVQIDLAQRRVTRADREITLRPKEFALLEYFIRNPHRVLSRSAIGEHVWELNFNPESNVIDVYVASLRRKLDKPFDTPLIHTVVGSGYRFGQLETSTDPT